MRTQMKTLVAALAIAGVTAMPTTASAANVGLELLLLTDVSGSVDTTEYDLQKQGYVSAFQSAAVQNAILGSAGGSIAVAYGEWSGANQQSLQVSWTIIDSVAAANAFAAAINNSTRAFSGATAPGSALNWGVSSAVGMFTNTIDSTRQVIDVSGDGSQNDGATTSTARDAALAAGVDAINGLPILGSEANLLAWYQNNIQGGAGSFTLAANSFADFQTAIESKLVKEISQVPEPFSAALVGLGLLGLGLTRRRQKQ